jgi:Flavodoxin reductases (ferredoxin-NADPH reductases) family 1
MADSKYTEVAVTARTDWLPGKLFSLRTTRPEGYAFEAGQFARLGLPAADAAPDAPPSVWRAYSMVSGPADPWLEFYSVVVPDGQFSPLLARLAPGDRLYLDKTAFGFLTLARFTPADDLWLIASGTGLSAYLSMLRDPATWRDYKRIFVVHGVRTGDELAYRDALEQPRDFPGMTPGQLVYLPVASREALPGKPVARLTTLLADGRLEALAGAALDPERSRVMLCGNPGMVADARKLLAARGFAPGRRGVPGNLAVENYW